jgi:hypothetical protein
VNDKYTGSKDAMRSYWGKTMIVEDIGYAHLMRFVDNTDNGYQVGKGCTDSASRFLRGLCEELLGLSALNPAPSPETFWVATQVAVSEDCGCAVVLGMLSYTSGDMEGKAKAAREAMRLVAPTIDVFLWSSTMVGSPGPEIGQRQAVRRVLAAAKAIEAEVRRQWPDALPTTV